MAYKMKAFRSEDNFATNGCLLWSRLRIFCASPNEGFEFSGWMNHNGSIIYTSPVTSLTFTKIKTLRQFLKEKFYTLNFDSLDSNKGTVFFNDSEVSTTIKSIGYFDEFNLKANPSLEL